MKYYEEEKIDLYDFPVLSNNWMYVKDISGNRIVLNTDSISEISTGNDNTTWIYIRGKETPIYTNYNFEELIGLLM